MTSPAFVPDLYKGRLVTVINDRHNKGHSGVVWATRPGGDKVDVRITDRPSAPPAVIDLCNLVDAATGIALADAVELPPAEYYALTQRHLAILQGKHLTPLIPDVGTPSSEWPEVATATQTSPAVSISQPAITPRPGEWLRSPKLAGLHVDAFVDTERLYHLGRYDRQQVCIPRIPAVIPSKASATIQIIQGKETEALPLKFQLRHLQPLTTNQHSGLVSYEEARSIMGIWGVGVAIIGPSTSGSEEYIGKLGWIAHGGVQVEGAIVPFPETSLTRSEHREIYLTSSVAAVPPF